MTASLPDIGTLSVFPSVPKRKKKEERNTKKRFKDMYYTTDLTALSYLNVNTHQIHSHCFVFQLLQGRGGKRRQTVSKYARKLRPRCLIYACTWPLFFFVFN